MPRNYESPARHAQRDSTRRRIVQVAGASFASHGYTATTLRMVAAEAHVSLERVTSIGGKPALLLAAYEEALNDGEPLGLTTRSDIAPAWAGDDLHAILTALVDYICASIARVDGLTAALIEARQADPGVARAYEDRMRTMRDAGRDMVDALIDRGLVDRTVDSTAVADEFWAAAHETQYQLLVNLAGWTPQRYRSWLLDRTVRLIPPPRGGTATT